MIKIDETCCSLRSSKGKEYRFKVKKFRNLYRKLKRLRAQAVQVI